MGKKLVPIYVIKRPFVERFLSKLSGKYEIGIFTASMATYAESLLARLDPEGHIRWALYRDSCTFYRGSWVKNLSNLPRELTRTIIIDDRKSSFQFHPENGVECRPFYGDATDDELLKLERLLFDLNVNTADLRPLINPWINCA
eukprot:gb/GECG01003052.1/.p1 GENE.gb/GECG01003052.1/~~gb/GECG01003052.1/.p1  ORF type:complete len:144 (+),score=11.41 gb/GECG01003052.1/:1-432(+)